MSFTEVRAKAIRIGYRFLDTTTRSWGGFWGTIWCCLGYALWNSWSGHTFDPYPYVFLTLLITLFSYLQNIVIMTDLRVNDAAQKRQEELQRKQLGYMLHLLESQQHILANRAGVAAGSDPDAAANVA